MSTKTHEYPKPQPPDQGLEEILCLLTGELKAARQEYRRLRRRLTGMAVALAILLAGAGWSLFPLFTAAEVQQPQPPTTQMSVDARARQRAELLAMLPADKQRELQSFEQQVDWLSGYMHTWDEGKAGAVVAIMLFRMAQSMEHMSSMEQQMRAMSGQMGALPAIVAELNQINVKMSVITASMDSTMGRAGRMMPWMPFTP